MAVTGRVVLAATPLGDPGDASARLVQALATADVVAAEDTRRTRRLAGDLGVRIAGRIVSFYDAVEADRVGDLVAAARDGATVLVVSDAGMPTVSDPAWVRTPIDRFVLARLDQPTDREEWHMNPQTVNAVNLPDPL